MRVFTSGISTFYFRNHFRTRMYEKRPDVLFAMLYSKTARFGSRLRWQYSTFCSSTFAMYINYNTFCLFTCALCIQANTFRSFEFVMCKHSTTLAADMLGSVVFYNVCCDCKHHRQSSTDRSFTQILPDWITLMQLSNPKKLLWWWESAALATSDHRLLALWEK